VPWIRDDLLVVWRGMEDPPKLPWPGEDVEVEEYTSPPPHEIKSISMRFVGRGLVGMVREPMQLASSRCGCAQIQRRRVKALGTALEDHPHSG
jgi:hypothetical protein